MFPLAELAKLRFGKAKADDIPPKPSGIKRTVTHAPVDTLSANVHKSYLSI